MKVRIAFVTKPGTDEIDTDRVGSIEDHPDEDAKRLIKDGIAAAPTAAELEDWDAEVARRLAAEGEDLSALTVKQLRDKYPAAAAMPANTKKDDLVAAVEEARRAEIVGDAAAADGEDVTADDDSDAGNAESMAGKPDTDDSQ